MNCGHYQKLISEYEDCGLAEPRRREMRSHLHNCASCARFARDVQTMRAMLQAVPLAQTSRRFDAHLAERIAQLPKSAARQPWLQRAARRLKIPAWRPALALGAAAAGIAGAALFWHPATPRDNPAIADGILVTHCVQQHRSYVGAQPLSDIAAQNLANQLDQTASAEDAGDF